MQFFSVAGRGSFWAQIPGGVVVGTRGGEEMAQQSYLFAGCGECHSTDRGARG